MEKSKFDNVKEDKKETWRRLVIETNGRDVKIAESDVSELEFNEIIRIIAYTRGIIYPQRDIGTEK